MPWSYLFHIPFAICINNFSVEIYQNFTYCQVFEEAQHVKAHSITFYLAEYFILLAEICIFQLLKLFVRQLIKRPTKLLLQTDRKCFKNHPSKRRSEGQQVQYGISTCASSSFSPDGKRHCRFFSSDSIWASGRDLVLQQWNPRPIGPQAAGQAHTPQVLLGHHFCTVLQTIPQFYLVPQGSWGPCRYCKNKVFLCDMA